MKRSLACSLTILALACGVAHADGSGTLYQDGKPLALVSAYAYRGPDPFEKTKEITTIVFSDRKIDAAAANAAANRGEAVEDQLRRDNATRVELNLENDGTLQNVNIVSGGSSGSQSGSGWYTMKLAKNDAKRIEGTFRTNDEADKKTGRFYDLRFALDIPGPPDLGAALPPGGGEPAKAYMAYLAALKKGDLDAIVLTAMRKEPQRRYALRLAKQRLHQPAFRTRVLLAYRTRCAVCELKHGSLLDAAHIIPDSAEHGTPTTPNGLALCKIHHAAFDQQMLGISPDYVVHIDRELLEEVDGPMLRHGLQEMHGRTLTLPTRPADRPDQDLLASRWDLFANR